MSDAEKAPDPGRRVIIRLTPEQRAGIRELTGLEAECVECSQEELEMKLAPCMPHEKHLHGLWVALGLDD